MRPELRRAKLKKVKTPGGRTVYHKIKKKTSYARCCICKKPLSGVPRVRPYKLKSMAKTKKRPERMYGGVLCPRCLRKKIFEAVTSGEVGS